MITQRVEDNQCKITKYLDEKTCLYEHLNSESLLAYEMGILNAQDKIMCELFSEELQKFNFSKQA